METLNAGVWLHIKIIFPFQVRTSYVPGEILWGYRFEHKCVSYDKGRSQMMSPAELFNLIRALLIREIKGNSRLDRIWN